MRLVLPVLGVVLGAGVCCCSDLLTAGLEKLGLEAPAELGGASIPEPLSTVPAYQGAQYQGGASAGEIASGTWLVPDGDVAEIVEFYRLVLELDGWQIDHLLDTDQGTLLQASKDRTVLSLTASVLDAGKVQIVISVQEKAETG